MDSDGLSDGLAALEAKRLGQRVVGAACAEFVRRMRERARFLSLTRGSVDSDELRRYAALSDLEPASPNAWGCVFAEPGWEVVGRRRSTWPSNRAREIKVWRWRPAR